MVPPRPASKKVFTRSVRRRWLEFLENTNTNQRNREILTEYFLRQFTKSPICLYEFLLFLRTQLRWMRDPRRRSHLAAQFLEILSPLAERFGLFEQKIDIDNLCFRILKPRAYREVEHLLSRYKRTSQRTVAAITDILHSLLQKRRTGCEIEGRYKNVYSVYRKLQQKRCASPLHLHDIFAFRITLHTDEIRDCFDIVNILHDHFSPVAGSFKDYITIPKINGYQSIHTILNGVVPDLDLPVEVQIRTRAMHEFAERGLASHWLYTHSKRAHLITEKERKLIEHFTTLSKSAGQENSVLCFSPKGDIFTLVRGSSIIDFAYHVHTDVGNRAVAARVNGKQETLQYEIREGDRIEILRAENPQVKTQWLKYATHPSTRRRIYAHTRP